GICAGLQETQIEEKRMKPFLTDHPFFNISEHVPRWLIHSFFWVSYVVFFALMDGDNFYEGLEDQLFTLPVKMIVVYLTLYVLIPMFFLKGRSLSFFLAIFVLFVVAGLVQRGLVSYILVPMRYNFDFLVPFWDGYRIGQTILAIAYVTIFASAIKISRNWYNDHLRARELMQEKLAAELKFLRAQIHPHFLFNTLNNLYALTLKKSDQAPEVVLRLSGLVNYMLYDANASMVPLSKEIDCLHNYVALERIRYGDSLDLRVEVSGDIAGKHIAPMLLIPFVENSFKHGVSDDLREKWIRVHLLVNGPRLHFTVENSRAPQRNVVQGYKGGIGLKNVKRRLDLRYPKSSKLAIEERSEAFYISLQLDLDELQPTTEMPPADLVLTPQGQAL
ncbi:MAG: histidine kinase, partial [Bacteroidota bacterium]